MTGGPGARTGAAGGAGCDGGAEELGGAGARRSGLAGRAVRGGGAGWREALARRLRRPRTGVFRGPGVSRRARDPGAAHPARRDIPCVVREAAPGVRRAEERSPATRRGPRPTGEDRRGGPVSGGWEAGRCRAGKPRAAGLDDCRPRFLKRTRRVSRAFARLLTRSTARRRQSLGF